MDLNTPTIKDCENIFLCLMKQLKQLEEHNLTIPIYNLKDIKKNGEEYCFVDDSKTFSLEKDMIVFNKLFIKNDFTANEILSIRELPTLIFKTASYWSLGKIIEHCVGDKNIEHSKLYWALKRCLENNPRKRYLVYI